MNFNQLPQLGQALENGIFAGLTTLKDGTHAAVVLLPNKSDDRLDWNNAITWAEAAGGHLPTRPVAALLYANVKSEFERDWYWTIEAEGSGCAWCCHFNGGRQHYGHKGNEGSVRAVRLIQLIA